jgi:hypothetical protein
MAFPIAGPGMGLPFPQNLYPSEIGALLAPYDYATNTISLAAGQQIPIPPGPWFVGLGKVTVLQYLDPVTGVWRMHPWTSAARHGMIPVNSDGFTYRVANLTGCPVSGVVTAAGSGYPSNTTVTSSAGGSTWQPIVGGAISISSITNAGAGYGVAPLVFIPAPPNPGVPATADAAITGGSVTTITMRDQGAGYTVAPTITILPNPTDPNLLAGSAFTTATALASLRGSGSITAVLVTNPGAPQSTAPTLTISGTGGSGASITALLMQTMTGASVVSGGASIASAVFTAYGNGAGATPNTVFPNPQIDLSTYVPRPGTGTLATSGGSVSSISTLTDGGLFVGAAAVVAASSTGGLTAGANASAASITSTMGSTYDVVYLQPAGGD